MRFDERRPTGLDLFSQRAAAAESIDQITDFEAYAREVARLEGLDQDEVVAEAWTLVNKYALLWDQMRADGRVR
jgi:hypothetical protein